MPKKTLSQKDRALAIQALQGIRRQSDLLLLAFCYHKLKKHVAQRQQGTHLKRCAGLLKHHAIKKTVTCHFIRWLSATQRHTSIVSGMREPEKIVVLPRAQDFVELGVRYLGRWRLWVRHLRQRKQRNVMLLQNCTNKCLLHKIYLQWRSIQFRREKQRIEAHVCDIENKKSKNSASIEELKKQLQKQENTIKNLTRDAEKLQEKNDAQRQKLKNTNKTLEAAISMLDSKGGQVMVTRALRVAEEMAQQGDDVPHRLLIACADAGNALGMLRKTLPNDGALLDGKEAVANAVCQQVKALNTAATEKEQKANTLRAAMLEALKELEKTGNAPSVRGDSLREERKQSLNVKRVAEEMAQQGDDVPHRLLIACADAGNALEMLRKTLPNDGALLDGKEAVANAVCQQIDEMNDAVVRLREETIYNRNLALFLLLALKCGASKIIAVARHASPSSASSSERTADDRFSAFLPWCSCSDFTDLENLLHGRNGMEMVRIHLEEKRRLVTDGPSTANVLESFQCALVEIQETLAKCEDLFVEQEDVARQEEEKRKLLVEAAKDAVSALKGWTGENDMSVRQDEDDEVHLVMDVRRESEAASNTLAHLRNLLSGDIMGVSWSQDTLNSSTHSENPFFLQMPVIETHEDLVNAVTKLHSQLKEAGEAYNDMYLELRRLFPESSPSHLGNTRRASVSAAPAEELQQHPVKKKVDLVVSAVNRYIKSRGQEVKELRGVMRRGIEALGGSSDDPDTDDDMDADRSIARSAAVGEKLTLICRDTGEAIEDARTALGIPKDGKLKLSDVIPSLKDKVHTLEAVTKESAALIKEVKGALAYTPGELSSSRLRVLRPKRKPMSVTLDKSVMERMEAVKLSHTQISPKILDQSPLKPADFLRQVRRETQEKAAEMQELRDACSSIISLLDGSYRAGGEPPQYGQALLPLLMTQTQDLKRALHVVDSVLSFSCMHGNGSVGNYLTVLASQLASLRVGNESLRDGINQRMKQTTHLIGDFTNEINALKQVNKDLTTQVKSLRDKLQVQNQVRQHRAERMVEILRLKTIKDVLCKSFIMWLADVVSMRSTQVHRTTEERKRLSIEIVQKQHQQNQLAKLLAITLHALPGGMPRNSNVLDTEHTLMQRAMEGSEGTALEVFVQKGLDAAKEWMRSLSSLFSGVVSLRCDIFAFQRLIAEGWSRHMEEACSQILAEASNKLKLIDKKEEMELNFLRNRVLDQESIAHAHEELTNEVSDLKERLELAQDCIEAQDEKIIKLQRANRDLQLNRVLSWDENAEHGPIANGASNAIFDRVSVESSMIKQAKGLALEAINAVVGRDLAACIGEVAELTLEMYRRTTTALEEIANTKSGALCSLPVVAESRLQELRGLYTVRNDIVARLPELFRAPYIE